MAELLINDWTRLESQDGALVEGVAHGLAHMMGTTALRAGLQPQSDAVVHQRLSSGRLDAPNLEVHVWSDPYTYAGWCILVGSPPSTMPNERHFLTIHQDPKNIYIEGLAMRPNNGAHAYYGETALPQPEDGVSSSVIISSFINSAQRFQQADGRSLYSLDRPAAEIKPVGIDSSTLRRLLLGMNSYGLSVAAAAHEQSFDLKVSPTYRLGVSLLTLLTKRYPDLHDLPPGILAMATGEQRIGFLIEDEQGTVALHEPATTAKSLSITRIPRAEEGMSLAVQYHLTANSIRSAAAAIREEEVTPASIPRSVALLERSIQGSSGSLTPTEQVGVADLNALLGRLIQKHTEV